ncbi:TIGR03086 family metal-binding protein [Trujillonella endophytica]|uniref:TIGR03086 family protein n=1 Tax=Trujillonella endophytica TaxID=673521 RepID=A0A1H8S0R7_9ACTN|nr:TIGR03086 family metal-binding protein [Trujillella endophytica]SEO72044.1 TIGR03086 family protein [Trujillella endophytica]
MPSDDAALLELFQRAQNAFTDRVDAVEAGRWGDESLPGWTVADLVAHLVDEARWIPDLLAGDPADQVEPRFSHETGALLGDDPLTAWEAAADAALAALATGDLAGTVHLSRGPTPVRDYLQELTADLVVHGWDLARATGGDERIDPALLPAAEALADRLPDGGLPGFFDPPLEVPAGASEQVRVLARYGRRAW